MKLQRQIGGRALGDARRRGFSMLELMFALTILSVGVMAAFSGQVNSLNLLSSSEETRSAVMDLQSALESILARGPDDAVATFPPGQPMNAYSSLHMLDQQIVPTYPNFAGGTIPDVLQVVVTCTWTDFEGRPRDLDLASVMVR